MKRLGLVSLLIGFSSLANAQSVPVRSGEHETFTRLVFELPASSGVEVTNTERQTMVSFERREWVPDLSEVFRRIPRSRLQRIEYSEVTNQTILYLNCACDVTTFWFAENYLVLDIADPGAPSVPNSLLAMTKPAISKQDTRNLRMIEAGSYTRESIAKIALKERLKKLFPKIVDAKLGSDTVFDTELDIGEGHQQVAREDSSAVDLAGLESSVDRTLEERSSNSNFDTNSEIERDFPVGVHQQISIRNAAERQVSDSSVEHEVDKLDICIPESKIDLKTWGSGNSLPEALAITRSVMFTERDVINDRSAYRLATTYLYYGFGAEASAVLSLVEAPDEDHLLLKALAEVVDEGISAHKVLSSQTNCDGPSSFWGVFEGGSVSSSQRLNETAILQTLIDLPSHLRRHLGPIASQRLLDAGFKEVSDSISRIVSTTSTSTLSEATPGSSGLNQFIQGQRTSENDDGDLISVNGKPPADVVIQRTQQAASLDQGLELEFVELVGAMAFEFSDQPLGQELLKSHVLALALSNQFTRAYNALDADDALGTDEKEKVRSQVTSILARRADDIVVLEHYFTNDAGVSTDWSEQAAIAISSVLISNGFALHAEDVLNRDFSSPMNRTARLLRAEAALKMGHPRRAEQSLVGLHGEDVDHLKRQVQIQDSELRKEIDFISSTISTEPGLRDSVNPTDDIELRSDEANTRQTNDIPALRLDNVQDLLRNVESSRDSFSNLLLDNPMPDTPATPVP